jgi:Rrf2 family transcriptional regulator, nitric oxide-sensitive transcriptional repressor
MRLSTFTDYSLRMLMYVAAAPQGRATIAQVARAFAISENHLVKVAHVLGKEGFLLNTRGRGGGLRLARPPAEINVGKVVRLTEGGDMPAECFDRETNTCALAGSCALQRMLGTAVEEFYGVLEQYTVADLRAQSRKLDRIFRLSRLEALP